MMNFVDLDLAFADQKHPCGPQPAKSDANLVRSPTFRQFFIESLLQWHQLCNVREGRLITKTIARVRASRYRGMKIDRDDSRTYRNCHNCSDTELTPARTGCPAVLAVQQVIGALFSSTNLYEDNIE
ncbi:hypothetical protein TNCV_4125531 [Trichonephila clavipes]|nr:hypothetical protein TNCV_4125531 [Trichonephila clavipes]